ncbi:phosphohistidine phosphatase SixA [Herbaspirillum sp. Sphag1AN]|uniref:histidine phosphatase family protein n=1 Tax=unclassified Herbaspirillum TaxID=2624150 RepID=UPI001614FD20|nr:MULTISPECIES: histidine phosphatase family protein [unclassified Herbaspirillum]MBB3211244.1 phosphohistidine phosphatase SixA [Herbaspirillum sp. Sphag1AN]MBB3244873.1 phosphohistidine phosphatase SixA [Herbaspirillum sp. Sphag64]
MTKLIASIFCQLMLINSANASELSEQLASPNYVLIMRHARAPGIGDPDRFSLDDCGTQRNLSDEGREQARKVGLWLHQQNIQSALVVSSPWCRTKETGTLLNYGTAQPDSALASFFDDPASADSANIRLEQFIVNAVDQKHRRALILVTHEINIERWIGVSVAAAEMVLVHIDAHGKPLSHKVYPRPE